MIYSVLLVLTNILNPECVQEKKTPDELTVQARRKSGAIEFRVGYAPWMLKEQELLVQLGKAGAIPDKMKISLLMSRSLSYDESPRLEKLLRDNKYYWRDRGDEPGAAL